MTKEERDHMIAAYLVERATAERVGTKAQVRAVDEQLAWLGYEGVPVRAEPKAKVQRAEPKASARRKRSR